MENKSQKKNWSDVQIAIAAIALTLTLGFWNLFSVQDNQVASTQPDPVTAPPVEDTPLALPQPTLLPGVKILLGGAAPQLPQVQVVTPIAPRVGSPKPVTTTRSSQP